MVLAARSKGKVPACQFLEADLESLLVHNEVNIFQFQQCMTFVTRNHAVINMHHFVKLLRYDKYSRRMCGDLKVVAHVLGSQLGCKKICCFLTNWDSRAKESHYYKKFWEELIAYFLLTRHEPRKKQRLQQFFVAAGNFLPSRYLVTIGGYRGSSTDTRPTILLLFLVLFASGTCLPSLCLATIVGMDIQTHRLMGGIYEVRC
jgi:hypothetical protein